MLKGFNYPLTPVETARLCRNFDTQLEEYGSSRFESRF